MAALVAVLGAALLAGRR
ncbi:hypothetical protein [Halolamina pelagica]